MPYCVSISINVHVFKFYSMIAYNAYSAGAIIEKNLYTCTVYHYYTTAHNAYSARAFVLLLICMYFNTIL